MTYTPLPDRDSDYEAECAELRALAREERRLQQRLLDHPDPRDPDYPLMDEE